MNKELIVYFDGACEPHNPGGIATWGIVIYDSQGELLHKDCGLACQPYSRQSTNNYAEYSALIRALEYCIEAKAEKVAIFGDSQLAVRQIQGVYRVKSLNILPLFEQAKSLIKCIKKVEVNWVPRERNSIADSMSKKAYANFQKSGAGAKENSARKKGQYKTHRVG